MLSSTEVEATLLDADDHSTDADLALRLREARQALSQSLEAIARPAKVSTAYLHKLEGGKVTTPSPRVLLRLGEVLGVPYWELMRLAGYVPAEVESPPPTAAQVGPTPASGPADFSTRRIVGLLETLLAETREVRRIQDQLTQRPTAG